ncbi:hypothetical protein CCZ01_06200 [Helicobacter monodelphidis]|uniref:DUF4879 domain-containing protein n=1 Tax=Helicobacter sp. 15-1451 TaxID=2004995 RepID=UPI000DCC80EE|nr:DUF4879 domain-containing protein [Helicobacter sp. 15-1451]RAX57426.1 hypothetical protein CCZ01_06200 [Helicobacter sp. 15-1451]
MVDMEENVQFFANNQTRGPAPAISSVEVVRVISDQHPNGESIDPFQFTTTLDHDTGIKAVVGIIGYNNTMLDVMRFAGQEFGKNPRLLSHTAIHTDGDGFVDGWQETWDLSGLPTEGSFQLIARSLSGISRTESDSIYIL